MFDISFVGDSANVLVNVIEKHAKMPRNSKHETQRVTTTAEKLGSVRLKTKDCGNVRIRSQLRIFSNHRFKTHGF